MGTPNSPERQAELRDSLINDLTIVRQAAKGLSRTKSVSSPMWQVYCYAKQKAEEMAEVHLYLAGGLLGVW